MKVSELESIWQHFKNHPWRTLIGLLIILLIYIAGMWTGGYIAEKGRQKAITPDDSDSVVVFAIISPERLRPGEKYTQKFEVENLTLIPIWVYSVSADVYSNGKLDRSTSEYFDVYRHGLRWNWEPIPPGQKRVIYDGTGTYTEELGCGKMKVDFTFHTSVGLRKTSTSFEVICS